MSPTTYDVSLGFPFLPFSFYASGSAVIELKRGDLHVEGNDLTIEKAVGSEAKHVGLMTVLLMRIQPSCSGISFV